MGVGPCARQPAFAASIPAVVAARVVGVAGRLGAVAEAGDRRDRNNRARTFDRACF